MRVYSARGKHQAVSVTYERCRSALEALGLLASPALEEAQRATTPPAPTSAPAGSRPLAVHRPLKDERRLVSVLFAELSGPVGMGQRLDPEELRQVVGDALAGLIAEVEGLGGTVTAVSGAGSSPFSALPKPMRTTPSGQSGLVGAYCSWSEPVATPLCPERCPSARVSRLGRR
jgi:class 3 adenylate cyclase